MSFTQHQAVAAVAPRPAATTLILRDAPGGGLQVLMVRRSLQASFMPGAYVFPGGAVDAADGEPATLALCDEDAAALQQRLGAVTGLHGQAAAYAVGALRECFEECGLWLGAAPGPTREPAGGWPALRARLLGGEALAALARAHALPLATSALQPWARWVTPVGLPKRFDTLFVLAAVPAGQTPREDAGETTSLAWVQPDEALAEHAAGRFPMEFATVSIVRSLQPQARRTVQAVLQHAAALPPLPVVQPRLKLDEQGRIRGVLLPGQPGFDDAAG